MATKPVCRKVYPAVSPRSLGPFTTPFTVPGNIKIEVEKGAILAGTITGLTYATPAMFGAKGDGNLDDAAAIQKSVSSGAAVVAGENRLYRISAKIALVHMTDLGHDYPVSGILVYNPGPAYTTSHNVNIIDNYIGQSNKGIGIYVDVPAGLELTRLKIRGNTVEASSLRSFDWELQTYSSWSTEKQLMYLRHVSGADISGNTFTDKSTFTNPAIEFAGCKDIMFHNNNLHSVGSRILVGSDAGSERISALGNKIIDLASSRYKPFNLLGASHLIKDNPGTETTP